MNIEMLGVNHVKTAIAKTDYLVPHINDNDREPSWDGDIEVYKKPGNVHAKADLILKVPIQVKGHVSKNLKKKTISYPVEFADMENYLNMGGTVFLVVYVDESGDKYRIYYAEFLPFELKRIIRSNEEKRAKTKNITMKALPVNKVDISNIILGFAHNMKKQRPAIYSDDVSLEEIVKTGTIPELSFGFSYVPGRDLTPFDLMLKGNVYLYAKLPHGIELPVEHLATVEMTGTTLTADVTANGKLFYNKYEVVYKKDSIELRFGKSTTHTINRKNNKKQKFSFTLQGTLSERIRDEEFIIEALTAQQFEVSGTVCPMNEATDAELASFNLLQRKEHLDWLKTVKEVLDRLDCRVDLDCASLTEVDENNIQLLKSAVIDGQAVPIKDTGSAFGFFNIANLKLLICALKKDDDPKLFRIQSYNDAKIEVKAKDDDGSDYLTSYYVLLKKDAILKCSNLNLEKMVAQLKAIPLSGKYSGQVILLLLELLRAYDESNPKRKDILNGAYEIAKWLKESDLSTPSAVLTLNYCQVIKRMRSFNDDEKQSLLSIIENNPNAEDIYTGAYLLLDNQDAAGLHYRKMDTETQAVFREYPIFRFWKDDKEENN